jgi:hypothetical protein
MGATSAIDPRERALRRLPELDMVEGFDVAMEMSENSTRSGQRSV